MKIISRVVGSRTAKFLDIKRRAWGMARLFRRAGIPDRDSLVLFWVPGGMPLMLHVEGAIAAALRLRGIRVHAVICDGPFRACMRREVQDAIAVEDWPSRCPGCRAQTGSVLDSMSIPYSYIGDFLPHARRQELWKLTTRFTTWDSLNNLWAGDLYVGKNAQSAIVRYLQGADLAGNETIIREYAYSALMVAEASLNAFDRMSPTHIFTSHGIYVDWGPALSAALSRGLPITAWMDCYLPWRFYFRHVEDPVRIDFHNMSHAAWKDRKDAELTSEEDSRLNSFFEDRYHEDVSFDMKRLKKYRGISADFRRNYAGSSEKPVWGIMAHINWDAVCDRSPMAHETFDEWIVDTVKEIWDIRDVQWLVKVHPAEAWDNTLSGVHRLISRRFPQLPDHIRLIPAEEEINPLDFFEMIDGAVTVYGTAGLEVAILGKPVILAGEAHYGGKGFTYDGLTPEHYREFLRKASSLKALTERQKKLARQYAYCYFLQRQIPFPPVAGPDSTWWEFQHSKRHLLSPGGDPFVDFICDRILDGQDFVMDDSLVRLAEGLFSELRPASSREA